MTEREREREWIFMKSFIEVYAIRNLTKLQWKYRWHGELVKHRRINSFMKCERKKKEGKKGLEVRERVREIVKSERNIFSSCKSIARQERLPDFRCKCGIWASIISQESNNLNGRMSLERQSYFLSSVRKCNSKHDLFLRFRDTCPFRVFKRDGISYVTAKLANSSKIFERWIAYRLTFLTRCYFEIPNVNFSLVTRLYLYEKHITCLINYKYLTRLQVVQ